MAPAGSTGLTRIGFRRDVKLFLAALVGYLIVVILALLLILQNSVITTAQTAEASWASTSEFIAGDLNAIEMLDTEQLQSRLTFYRSTFPLLAVTLDRGDGNVVRSGFADSDFGHEIAAPTRHGRLVMIFDDSFVRHERWKFNLVAAIVIGSTLLSTLLLVLYLPKIVRPIEEMLDHAREVEEKAGDVDEAHYLVETFKRSLDTLRSQKDEITRLHEIEKSRADDLERVTSTLKRSIASGFLAVNAVGQIVELNRAAREILDIDPPMGEPIERALPVGSFGADLARALADGLSLTRHETLHVTPHGQVPVGLTTVPLRDEAETCIGMIAIFTDLTRIRSLESRLREMQTLADLGEISTGIAHEFRNSLGAVLGYLRLAGKEADGETRKRIDAAADEATQLSEAVSKLLGFARKTTPEFRVVDLAGIATDVVARLQPEARGVELIVEPEATPVRGDASLLRVVVENLVRNAIDAARDSAAEPRVVVRTSRAETGRLVVSDNGAGIPESEIDRVFLPFQSGKPGGFGMGLALSRKIVLQHDGDIRLSRRDGWTDAEVELPTP